MMGMGVGVHGQAGFSAALGFRFCGHIAMPHAERTLIHHVHPQVQTIPSAAYASPPANTTHMPAHPRMPTAKNTTRPLVRRRLMLCVAQAGAYSSVFRRCTHSISADAHSTRRAALPDSSIASVRLSFSTGSAPSALGRLHSARTSSPACTPDSTRMNGSVLSS